ncbi:hypothetical protein TIFTF001_016777 [Ficus carica]|uniref:Uncharacterized protein n=1 Tax=Ficus carica TaxID=3494 RepID=A0AA88DIW9_FICCA|nr:hypothetical protein TIFTF001_016777 [Ficus carica]
MQRISTAVGGRTLVSPTVTNAREHEVGLGAQQWTQREQAVDGDEGVGVGVRGRGGRQEAGVTRFQTIEKWTKKG